MITIKQNAQSRKPNRLKTYDYSQLGTYFVTICTHNMKCFFGSIIDEQIKLNQYGNIAHNNWLEISQHFKDIILDKFIIMPNHVHGIIRIDYNDDVGNAYMHSAAENTHVVNAYMRSLRNNKIDVTKMLLPKIIQQYKSSVTRYINNLNGNINFKWQKSYYDRIIRNEKDLNKTREYIMYNALKWDIEKI